MIVLVNSLTWGYDRYAMRWEWSKVSPATWWQNVRTGFRWDDDALTDNQLAHPLNGALYFNAARGVGYSFWKSVPFVALGSLTWEFLAENVPPSPNAVINTTLGGTALGEVTSRLATLLTHRADHRPNLQGRLAAAALDPVGHAQHWVRRKRVPAPFLGEPTTADEWLAVGIARELKTDTSPLQNYRFARLGVRYGDAFTAPSVKPFDAFELNVELARRGSWTVQRLAVSGLLARSSVQRTNAGVLIFCLNHNYEFL
ncbi:MAG: DUF3943 domain-containing protein, partial [Gemmatimonadales bacterium]